MTPVVLLVVGAAMFAFGRWGRRNVAVLLATSGLSPEARQRKERSIRRGGVAWQLSATLPLVAALVMMLDRLA